MKMRVMTGALDYPISHHDEDKICLLKETEVPVYTNNFHFLLEKV